VLMKLEMKHQKNKTYMAKIYGITALSLLIISFFTPGSFDIALHDRYVIISKSQITVILALLFAFFTLILWILERNLKQLSPILNWLHFGLTVCGILILEVITSHSIMQIFIVEFSTDEINKQEIWINEWLSFLIVVVLFSQVLFIFNILRAFILKPKNGSN
jgi:FtsH-binding integral membrane protein